MNKETTGSVISVAKQWWFKINTKPFRKHALDGATFPHIIKVAYTVDGKDYTVRKWLWPKDSLPAVGDSVPVRYSEANPKKAKVQ